MSTTDPETHQCPTDPTGLSAAALREIVEPDDGAHAAPDPTVAVNTTRSQPMTATTIPADPFLAASPVDGQPELVTIAVSLGGIAFADSSPEPI